MPEQKKEIAKTFLQNQLRRGHYRFGEKISTKALCAETGASRFMVNSALNELRAEGFLEITAQVGCKVIHPTTHEVTDFFVVFSRLEGAIAEFAAERRDLKQVALLHEINNRLRNVAPTATDAGEMYRTLNLDFHRIIHAAAKSTKLEDLLFTYWAMEDFLMTQTSNFREHIMDSALEHDEIILAIGRGDPSAARALMESHIRRLGHDVVADLYGTDASVPSYQPLQIC